jgi:hypothetical protein
MVVIPTLNVSCDPLFDYIYQFIVGILKSQLSVKANERGSRMSLRLVEQDPSDSRPNQGSP